MSETMVALGNFRFSINSSAFQTLSRKLSMRWSVQERLKRRPVRQFVGPGDETIDLEGVIYPHYQGGMQQIDLMRKEAERGTPLHFTTSAGLALGKWCIDNVEDTSSYFMRGGIPQKVEFRITLSRYGDDES